MTPALTVRDIAAREQVSLTVARRYFTNGEIPGAYRTQGTSGPWRVTEDDFEAWRERRKSMRSDPWVRSRPRRRTA